MKNILITGGLGFIGTKLAKKLILKKMVKQCILLDNFGGYINPSYSNFHDYRKLRLKKFLKINLLSKEQIQIILNQS